MLGLLLCMLSVISPAQKVALVLSGGGAKGCAHIGVLKALEEYGIPVSCVAGTSMGAIIGGLYASGYSPDEMEKIVTSEEFQNWAWGEIEDKYIYYFKEKPANGSWINFKFNYDSVWQYKLPTNIISPYQVDFGMMYFLATAGAAANNNFDSLFVPYRCVASDIAEKKAVVFSKGYLPEAVRASMTYPFYFKPIRVDGRLLFDGGMYNNFPADVAYNDFNPDIIIGSNVASNSAAPEDGDLINQIQNMLMVNTNYDVVCDNGVMITPRLPHTQEFDFSEADALIQAGYDATVAKMAEIRKSVYDTVKKADVDARRKRFNDKKPPLVFDSIGIDGLNKVQSFYIYKLLLHRSRKINAEDLKVEYFKLLADDKIESIYPKALFNKNKGLFDLNLRINRDKNFLAQFGGIISSGPINGAYLGIEYKNLGASAVTLHLDSYIGRFYSALSFKTRLDFPTALPFYWETSVVLHQWDYFKTTTRFFEDKKPSYLIQNEFDVETSLAFPMHNKGKFEFGGTMARLKDSYYQTNIFVRTDTADRTYFNMFTPFVMVERKTLNEKQYAYSGTNLMAELRYITGKETCDPGSTAIYPQKYSKQHQWFQFRILYDNYFRRVGPLRLGFYGEGMFSTKPLFNNYTASILGTPAFQPTPESKTIFLPNYRAPIYAAAGLKGIVTLYKKIHFRAEGYIFQPWKEIRKNADLTAAYGSPLEDRYFMANAALVYHSPVCPISLSFGYFPGSDDPYSFMFNIGYIIFNRRALD